MLKNWYADVHHGPLEEVLILEQFNLQNQRMGCM